MGLGTPPFWLSKPFLLKISRMIVSSAYVHRRRDAEFLLHLPLGSAS
jgi:hypothetical protein